jgi:hypothetical protein
LKNESKNKEVQMHATKMVILIAMTMAVSTAGAESKTQGSNQGQGQSQGGSQQGQNSEHRGPSREDMDKLKACVEKKGVKMPPPPERGKKPNFDTATKEALDACHTELGIPKPPPGEMGGQQGQGQTQPAK